MSELTQLIDKEIPDGRQSLQENFNNLERLAQYCQENYIKVVQEIGVGGVIHSFYTGGA